MRILHLTTFVQGGAGLALVQLAAAQRSAGHHVVAVTSQTAPFGYGNYPAHLKALEAAGVPVHAVDSSFSRDEADNARVTTYVRRTLGGAAAFDLMHTHAAVPTRIAVALAARARRRPPIVQTMHGWGRRKSPEQTRDDVEAMGRADRVVVPSEHSRTLLVALGVPERSIRVVAYGVEPRVDEPSSGDRLLADMRAWRQRGGEVLCTVGTVGERKNQRTLVDALALTAHRDSLLLVVVGEGETDQLETRARALGVDASVRVCGYRADARAVAAAADYLVLPSLSEGQPLSILEAWADGVPVLCSRTPELIELTAGGEAAVLFDPTDPVDIARAIATLRRTSSAARRRLVDRARARYRSCFTVQTMVDGYLAEYAELSAGRRRVA